MKRKALVVDDELCLLEGCIGVASLYTDFDFITAKTVDEGLQKLVEESPEIIFLDKYFFGSNKSGHDFVYELRNNVVYEKYSKIPVIGIGFFEKNEMYLLTQYCPKPLDFNDFEGMITKYCK
jgi:response regulator of citrate/malate metabolism